jgi:hypothetical protein
MDQAHASGARQSCTRKQIASKWTGGGHTTIPERVPSASRMPKYLWSTARCGAIRKSACPDKDRGGATFRTTCEDVHCGEDEEAASDQEQVSGVTRIAQGVRILGAFRRDAWWTWRVTPAIALGARPSLSHGRHYLPSVDLETCTYPAASTPAWRPAMLPAFTSLVVFRILVTTRSSASSICFIVARRAFSGSRVPSASRTTR